MQDKNYRTRFGLWQVLLHSSMVESVRACSSVQKESKPICSAPLVLIFTCLVRIFMYFMKIVKAIFSYQTWWQTTSVFAMANKHEQCLVKYIYPYTSKAFLGKVKTIDYFANLTWRNCKKLASLYGAADRVAVVKFGILLFYCDCCPLGCSNIRAFVLFLKNMWPFSLCGRVFGVMSQSIVSFKKKQFDWCVMKMRLCVICCGWWW